MKNYNLAKVYFLKLLSKLRHKEEMRSSASNYFRNRLSQVIQKQTLDSNFRANGQTVRQPSTLKPPSQMLPPSAPKAPTAATAPKTPKALKAPEAPEAPTQCAAPKRSNQIGPTGPLRPQGPIGAIPARRQTAPEPPRKQQYRRQS